MEISEKELLAQYELTVDNILDECDWKTHFTSEEVCGLVHSILKKNNEEPSVSVEELHEIYLDKIQSLKVKSTHDWLESYKVSEIISILYYILKTTEGPEYLDLPSL